MSAAMIVSLAALAIAAVAMLSAHQHAACVARYRNACKTLAASLDHHSAAREAAAWIQAAGEDRETASLGELTLQLESTRLNENVAFHRTWGTRRPLPPFPLPQRRASDRQEGCFQLSLLQNLALVLLVPLVMFAAQQLDPGPTAARAEQDTDDEVAALETMHAAPKTAGAAVESAVVAGLQPLPLDATR